MSKQKRELLPIGSVVEIEDGDGKPFMVYGRCLADEKGKMWDYLICAYPEGFLPGVEELGDALLLDGSKITKLLFMGYQTAQDQEHRAFLEDPSTQRGSTWDWMKGWEK